jgi:hypothetical protein
MDFLILIIYYKRNHLMLFWNHHHYQPNNVPTAGAQAFLMDWLLTRRMGHITPCGPSADGWSLPTANTTGTNGLTCLPKHGGARFNKFLVTHPMTDQCCLATAIVRRAHWPRGHRAFWNKCNKYHVHYIFQFEQYANKLDINRTYLNNQYIIHYYFTM